MIIIMRHLKQNGQNSVGENNPFWLTYYDIVIRDFELQWHYYVHFLTNTVGKRINPIIPPDTVSIV